MRTALITGIAGQDGAYLARLLLKKGYRVVGARRHGSSGIMPRLERLGIDGDVEIVGFDILEDASVRRVIERTKPDEVYNLAAQSSIAYGIECPQYTANANGLGVLRMLEAIREVAPTARFFQAGSSELFGAGGCDTQDEITPLKPRSPYGVAKAFAHWTTKNYRDIHGLHASSGILYNHTSTLQGHEFLAKKVAAGLEAVLFGARECLEVGNLDARRDWGFAGDYMEAAWRMLQAPNAGDYVIATGHVTTIRGLIDMAAGALGASLRWSGGHTEETATNTATGDVVIRVSPKFYRAPELWRLCGDTTKIRAALGWSPTTSLQKLVEAMVHDNVL